MSVMLLSSSLVSCRSKSCSCLDSYAHDASISFPVTKALLPPLESQKSDIRYDDIPPIAFQVSTLGVASSKSDVPCSDTVDSQSRNSSCCQPTTHGNDPEGINNATLELALEYEQGMATLQANHAQISQDLDTPSQAPNRIAEKHTKERVCSFTAHSALGAQLLENLQAQITNQERTNEISMQDALLDSLRTIRAQHARASQALRDESTINKCLTADLQAERVARKSAEDMLADLLPKNFALVEHNKLLTTRDTTLQNDISSFLSQSSNNSRMQLVLEDKSHLTPAPRMFGKDLGNSVSHSNPLSPIISLSPYTQDLLADALLHIQGATGPPSSITLSVESRQTALRAQLVTVQDELHITKRQLSITEQRCDTLSTKVACLQEHVSTCVDECGAALEVERELRYEVEARVQELLCETTALKDGKTDCRKTPMAWKETGDQVYRMSDIAVAAFERCDILEEENRKQRDLIRELSEKVTSQEGITEVRRLRDEVACYAKLVTGLQMREREHIVDMRFKTIAGQRLAQRKRKRACGKIKIYDEWMTSSQGFRQFCNLSSVKQVIRRRPASVPMIKALVKAVPMLVVRHARRLSKALTEYSMAELNNLQTNDFSDAGILSVV